MSVFGSRVKRLRMEKYLTQTELASLTGIDQSDLSKLERGIHKGNLKNATVLARALGTSIDYLIGATDQIERWEDLKKDTLK